MKKFYILLCSFLLIFSCFIFVGCSGKKIKYTLEAGDPLPSAADIVGSKKADFVTDVDNFDTNKVGKYTIKIADKGIKYRVELTIEDTTAPIAVPKDLYITVGTPIPEAKYFFSSVKESSAWTATFRENYTFGSLGQYSLGVMLEDEHGNNISQNVILNIITDTTPPVIVGPDDVSFYIGDAVSYKNGFTVQDNCFGPTRLDVDISGVDPTREGTYTATYIATDSAGLKSTKKVTVWVHKLRVTKDMLWQELDKTISQIITPGMSKEQQCRAIYDHVGTRVTYSSDSDKTDWVGEAYRAMYKDHTGDCFSFYAIAKAFMERLGIEYIDMQRLPGYTEETHFWVMVNIGTKSSPVWYHFDLCPVRHDFYHHSGCLLTDKQIDAYNTARPYYYERDRSKYPATSTKIITPTPTLEEFYS